MPNKYSPEQWDKAYRLYTEEFLTLREVAERTEIGYDRLAQRAGELGWSTDQQVLRAQREDSSRIERRLMDSVLTNLLGETDAKARAQLIYAYEKLKRLQGGEQMPRARKREVVQEFLVEFFRWLQEECPSALAAMKPIQGKMKAWIEEKFV
ncbi:MAG TPA: hypothetical protein DCP69_03195 [Candidatus Omnitrophica bacterium]|nr:hypothetical protein [Candidatus Omnitrophota bacterium]